MRGLRRIFSRWALDTWDEYNIPISEWEEAWAVFATNIGSIRSLGGTNIKAVRYTDYENKTYWIIEFEEEDGSKYYNP